LVITVLTEDRATAEPDDVFCGPVRVPVAVPTVGGGAGK
jgi:hypothetical protein